MFSFLTATNVVVDASTTVLGTVIYDVEAYDNDSTSLTFSMSSTPLTPDLFNIDQGMFDISIDKLSYNVGVRIENSVERISQVLGVLIVYTYSSYVLPNSTFRRISRLYRIAHHVQLFTVKQVSIY